MVEKLRRRNQVLKSARLFAEELEGREVPAALTVVPPGAGVNGDTGESDISQSGRYVVFSTAATDVVTGVTDGNTASDVYLFDRVAGTTTLVSKSAASGTATGDGGSFTPRISDDGQFVVFQSDATNLVTGQADTNGATDVFVYSVATGTVTLVSHMNGSATTTGTGGASYQAVISGNGQYIAFTSLATDIIAGGGDLNAASDVFLYSVADGTSTLVSRTDASATTTANALSEKPTISDDGSAVAFVSTGTDLVATPTDVNGDLDVFLFSRTAGTNTLVSRSTAGATTTGDAFSYKPQVSGNGQYVVFISAATDLITGTDANANTDVFLYDVAAGTTSLVSRSATDATATTAGEADYPDPNVQQSVISDDGSVVVYLSTATDLVAGQTDANGGFDVFAFDRAAGTNTLISRATGGATTAANGTSASPTVSDDGQTIAFESLGTDLVAGQTDTNGASDVFVFDRAGTAARLASGAGGSTTQTGNGQSTFPKISGDGSIISLISAATDLTAGVTSTNVQTYVTAAAVVTPPGQVLVGSGPGGALATVINTAGQPVGAGINPFPGFTGGIRTATADVNGDGVLDFIFGRGPGSTSEVVVIDGATRAEIVRFTAFEASFTGGVYVAAGDIDLDGKAEVIVTPDITGGPRVLIYTGANLTAQNTASPVSFFGIDDPNFRGGARAAVGDVNRDGIADLAVAAGFSGGPRVTIYDGQNLIGGNRTQLANFFIFESTFRNGAFISIGDVNGDGFGDVVAGAGETGGPRVRIISGQVLLAAGVNGTGAELASFLTGDANFRGGVRVSVADLDGDNLADVVTGAGEGASGRVIGYTGAALAANSGAPATAFDVVPFGGGFTGGVYVG